MAAEGKDDECVEAWQQRVKMMSVYKHGSRG